MTKQEQQDLKLLMYRMDESDKRVDELHKEFDEKLSDIHTDIKFIKENLFNPETGLWAETKENSRFRKSATTWGGILGAGVIAAVADMIWDFFTK